MQTTFNLVCILLRSSSGMYITACQYFISHNQFLHNTYYNTSNGAMGALLMQLSISFLPIDLFNDGYNYTSSPASTISFSHNIFRGNRSPFASAIMIAHLHTVYDDGVVYPDNPNGIETISFDSDLFEDNVSSGANSLIEDDSVSNLLGNANSRFGSGAMTICFRGDESGALKNAPAKFRQIHYRSSITMSNVTFHSNHAQCESCSAGAIMLLNGKTSIINSKFVNNSAGSFGKFDLQMLFVAAVVLA